MSGADSLVAGDGLRRHDDAADQQELYDNLHRNGVMCMISLAPTHDRRATDAQKIQGYELEIPTGCDVIETDYPYLFQNLDLNRK